MVTSGVCGVVTSGVCGVVSGACGVVTTTVVVVSSTIASSQYSPSKPLKQVQIAVPLMLTSQDAINRRL